MKIFDRDHRQAKHHLHGTHRSRSPAETLAIYLPLCASFGITRLANVTGLDYVGVPVYQCVRPNSRTLSVSQGKGLTPEAAKASALMESIEGWHGETMAVPTCYASPRDLAARSAILDLDRLPRSSRRPIDPDGVLPWVQGYDLLRSEICWVPYEVVDLNRVHGTRYAALFQSTSKGLASGNHLLEAISHGLCEVIEHDAHVLWHFDASDPLGTSSLVDLDTIEDPACRQVIDRFHAAGFTLGIQDITTDLGVPCYQCVAIDCPDSFRSLGYTWGQGCHLSPEVALLRALTEAAQSRLTFIAGARDDLTYEDYATMQHPDDAAALAAVLAEAEPSRDLRRRSSLATPTFEGDVEEILARLRAAGCDQVVVVDMTHETFGVPVTKVIVPGLEGPLVDPATYVPGERARRMRDRGARS